MLVIRCHLFHLSSSSSLIPLVFDVGKSLLLHQGCTNGVTVKASTQGCSENSIRIDLVLDNSCIEHYQTFTHFYSAEDHTLSSESAREVLWELHAQPLNHFWLDRSTLKLLYNHHSILKTPSSLPPSPLLTPLPYLPPSLSPLLLFLSSSPNSYSQR